ncbi:hypothetical protein FB45DRAFT_1116289 [Roridomyces roridus]|uniref:F-box domain-containing protein n=1 Tax=Roridomyces roridus TaxID=1738132 RepID=A0AAD7FV21_9AGAR|nr:hypothetical protein FB45DRAFT_1116289 [Roridomyces roridus]
MLSSRLHRARLAQIEQHMLVLENQMTLLRAEKETIENDLAAIVYPVLTLPNEITSQIFVHYVNDQRIHSPQCLLSVCSSWRQVALSTCWLFNRVMSRHVDQLASWIPLSGNLPLTLDFISYYPPSSHEFRLLCQLLSAYSGRWRSLTLATMQNGVLPIHLSGTFSSLITLSIESFGSSAEPMVIPMLQAPRLVELKLDSGRVMSLWETILPWTQLTKLELNEGLEHWSQFLPRTPNLEVLRITDSFRDGVPPNQIQFIPMIVLPQLHTLDFFLTDCCDLIQYLTLPALENLTIHFTPSWNWDMMELFVQRSRCTVRNIELWVEIMEADLIVDFFEDLQWPLSSVRQLTINTPTQNMLLSLFDALSDDDRVQFLPVLETLKIGDVQFNIPLIPIVDMLSARMQRVPDKDGNVANLKSFELTFGSELSSTRDDAELDEHMDSQMEEVLEQLRRLQSGGLRVDIQSTFKHMGDAIALNAVHTFLQLFIRLC